MKVRKRCQSRAPQHDVQCTKRNRHNRRDILVTHQAGDLVWGDPPRIDVDDPPSRGHTVSKAVFDEARMFNTQSYMLGNRMTGWQADFLDQAMKDTRSPAERELSEWWTAEAEDEIARTVPKAVEYGSTDLIDIGLMLARTMGREISDEEAAEMGVFFYLIGKIARWQSAIQRGERPSDDTLFDIGVYVRMAQRIRAAGGWPGTTEQTIKQQTYGMEPQ